MRLGSGTTQPHRGSFFVSISVVRMQLHVIPVKFGFAVLCIECIDETRLAVELLLATSCRR